MVDYATLKAVHVSAVTVSGTLFALRGVWRLARPDAVFARSVRIVPHVVDTLLLLSALGLAATWVRNDAPLGWITAKVVALLLYIAIGMIALRPGLPASRRITALAGAALVFGYIVSVALTRSPAGALRWLA